MKRERIRSTFIMKHTHYHKVIFIGSECEEKQFYFPKERSMFNKEMYKWPIYLLPDPLFPL